MIGDNKRTAGWIGLGLSIATGAIVWLDWLAKLFGIINIPKDARENLSVVSDHAGLITIVALLVAVLCTAYLYRDGAFSAFYFIQRVRSNKVEPLLVIAIGLAVVALGVMAYIRLPADEGRPRRAFTVRETTKGGITWSAEYVAPSINTNPDGDQIQFVGLSGRNVSQDDIEIKSAKLVSSSTDAEIDLLVNVPGKNVQVPVTEIRPVPPRASFQLETPREHTTVEDFIRRIGIFRFVIQYGANDTFSVEITPAIIKSEVAAMKWVPPRFRSDPVPQVTLRERK